MIDRQYLDYIKRQITNYSYLYGTVDTEREKRFYADLLKTYKKKLDEYFK
jgi:hypothetical protein